MWLCYRKLTLSSKSPLSTLLPNPATSDFRLETRSHVSISTMKLGNAPCHRLSSPHLPKNQLLKIFQHMTGAM